MQKIVPHLWFDTEAAQAAEFYGDVFKDSSVKNRTKIEGTPSGTVEILSIELLGQEFQLISAGPYFKFSPSVSFLVACETKEEVDRLYVRLHDGGRDLMPLDSYPFSERYVWLEDKFGLSWQLMYRNGHTGGGRITTALLFVGDVCGKAEEALSFYTSVFRNARPGPILRYGPGEAPDKEGTVKYAAFTLEGQSFSAMDSAHPHNFTFSEAVSFMVFCDTQDEIDYYWNQLSAHPESEQCGWLKDRYGVSWQIVPSVLDELMRTDDREKSRKVTAAFLQMKKFDIAGLIKAGR